MYVKHHRDVKRSNMRCALVVLMTVLVLHTIASCPPRDSTYELMKRCAIIVYWNGYVKLARNAKGQ